MKDSSFTRSYLIAMNAVFESEKIMIGEIIDSKIPIFTRKYYIKRNGKKCYIDSKYQWIPIQWDKIVKHRIHKSESYNDYNGYHFSWLNTYPNKDYKNELISNYKTQLSNEKK